MITRTLGGDRLGSGNKLKVEMHGYERSTHDLSYLWRSTMSAGTLVPFMSEVALPGDTFDINLDADIKTHPTIGPLFGSYKVQLDVFLAPIRLYNSLLHNNMLGIGLNMAQVKLPQIEFLVPPIDLSTVEDIDNAQINPSSIMSYLGLRGLGNNTTQDGQTRSFNAVPLLAYWDIFKCYYSNKQEGIGAVIHTKELTGEQTVDDIEVNQLATNPPTWNAIEQAPVVNGWYDLKQGYQLRIGYTGNQPDPEGILLLLGNSYVDFATVVGNNYTVGGGYITGEYDWLAFGDATLWNWKYVDATSSFASMPQVTTFDLDNIDTARREILKFDSTTLPFMVNDLDLAPYKYVYEQPAGIPNILASQEGLALKTYQSDMFNNWLDDAFISAISTASAVSTVGDSFTIDQLNLSQKVYDMLNRIAVSGGTYQDWIDTVYATEMMRRPETPVYMGGLIKELVFQEVISNASVLDPNTYTEVQPLGTLAGKGKLSGKHKGGQIYIKVDEPSYVIGIISLTPRVDYSQGNKWDTGLQTIDDLHKPALDQIGFQDLVTEQMAWFDTEHDGTNWVQKSAGKQPAWLQYMTNVNQTRGNFAISTNEMFMTLNRRYEYDTNNQTIKDLTTYIDPAKFNFIFAQTALDAQNFWAQIAVNITARRKMSAKIMPNL